MHIEQGTVNMKLFRQIFDHVNRYESHRKLFT